MGEFALSAGEITKCNPLGVQEKRPTKAEGES